MMGTADSGSVTRQEMLGAVFEGDGQQHGFFLERVFGVAGDFGEDFQQGESGFGAAWRGGARRRALAPRATNQSA
jgi:hypothetical protein